MCEFLCNCKENGFNTEYGVDHIRKIWPGFETLTCELLLYWFKQEINVGATKKRRKRLRNGDAVRDFDISKVFCVHEDENNRSIVLAYVAYTHAIIINRLLVFSDATRHSLGCLRFRHLSRLGRWDGYTNIYFFVEILYFLRNLTYVLNRLFTTLLPI
jgi:hypothetical protein